MQSTFITRLEHDALLDNDYSMLRDMLRYPHNWSLGGVRFYGMSTEYAHCVKLSIGNAIRSISNAKTDI